LLYGPPAGVFDHPQAGACGERRSIAGRLGRSLPLLPLAGLAGAVVRGVCSTLRKLRLAGTAGLEESLPDAESQAAPLPDRLRLPGCSLQSSLCHQSPPVRAVVAPSPLRSAALPSTLAPEPKGIHPSLRFVVFAQGEPRPPKSGSALLLNRA